MSKLFKTLLLLVVLVAVAAGLYALARGGKSSDNEQKQVTVEKGSITEKALAVGQIQPRQKFSIKSKISGIVRKCMSLAKRAGRVVEIRDGRIVRDGEAAA